AKPINEKTRKLSISPDYWYVTNAGLTILHPFLSGLFYNVGYTEKDEWINDDARYRALALTQYLVTGKEECPEFNLMLNKIFTGYPLEETFPAQVILSDFEKDEAVDLLKSVIHHWTALKNTSVDGLRSTFLLRDAKLSTNENGWLLQVGQKTVDVLMNKLPWGISIIKTPWMDKKMHVEWT
ncbi:MAG TPA: contractile injection system tape measure protein, partial [Cyclobacteriaceae bacterium]|nr:contractile injection system tape measure protein [Cyclobacteriaceae bacterium]